MGIKKPQMEEPENHERWLVSYADFITLLFAFFVVLYATSHSDLKKQKEFEKSVRSNLKLVVHDQGSSTNSLEKASDGMTHIKGDSANLDQVLLELNYPITKEEENINNKKLNSEDLKMNFQKTFGAESDMKKKGLELRHDALGIRISLRAATFFASGSAKLKSSSIQTLSELGGMIKNTHHKILIEGHTDNQSVENTYFPSNWELASNRATTVLRFLIKTQGIDPRRMAAISYADQKPLASNETEEGRSKNRRIEILLLNN